MRTILTFLLLIAPAHAEESQFVPLDSFPNTWIDTRGVDTRGGGYWATIPARDRDLKNARDICANHIFPRGTSLGCLGGVDAMRLCNSAYDANWAEACSKIDVEWTSSGAAERMQKVEDQKTKIEKSFVDKVAR